MGLLIFILLPVAAAFALPVLPGPRKTASDIAANSVTFVLFIASCVAVYALIGNGRIIFETSGRASPLGISLVLDGLSAMMLLAISFVSFMVTLFSVNYMEKFTDKDKYYVLLLLMIAGLNGVVLTGDLFNMYVFIELVALTSYSLVAFGCEAEELEGAFKYLVLGTIASTIILFSIAIIYSATGTLSLAGIAGKISSAPVLKFCCVLLFVGLGIKAALVPFHSWLPYAHPSAPAPISAMLSSLVVKTIGVYAFARIFFNVLGVGPLMSSVILFFGALSIVVGALLAVDQSDVKRMLAYSTISQVGYIFLGLGLATPLGVAGALFHLFNHTFMKSLMFLNSGSLEYATGTRDMGQMGGLKARMPYTFGSSLVGSLAIAGIPPLGGFWSKLIIILAAAASGHYIYAALAVLVSILTLGYLLRSQGKVFLGELSDERAKVSEPPRLMRGVLIILSCVCVLTGLLFPYVLRFLIEPAARVLVGGG
jgi:multicomponent Na+:H+ antiporter subunit D